MLEKEYILIVPPQTHAMLRAFLGTKSRVYEDPAYLIYALDR
jgi:hypothetical protein